MSKFWRKIKLARKIGSILLLTLAFNGLKGQDAALSGSLFQYASYYISSFDISTGASDVQLFRYRITGTSYPVYVKLWFKASMVSTQLGINSRKTIIEMETVPFELQAPLVLDNRSLSTNTQYIYDEQGNGIELKVRIKETLDAGEFDALLSSVMTTGRLADGQYTFNVKLFANSASEDNLVAQSNGSDSLTVLVESPNAINLESPGGEISDTSSTAIYANIPVFNWYSSGCNICNTYIRVAEFKPGYHTSLEEAVEGETSLPFNSSGGWYQVPNATSFQYPVSGAKPLEYGKYYTWQIKQSMSTTAGTDELLSQIYIFKIAEIGGTTSTTTQLSPMLESIRSVIGDDRFNAFFGTGGDLEGFTPSGSYSIDGSTVDASTISYILSEFSSGNLSITNIYVE